MQQEQEGENEVVKDEKLVQVTNVIKEIEVVEDYETEEVEEVESTSQINAVSTYATSALSSTSQFSEIRETAQAIEDMKMIAQTLIGGNLCPLKKVSDVVLAIITGNQYGFHFMTSVNNIFPINGKPTMSVHLHRALILKHKINFEKELDFEPMYDFARVGEDGKVMMQQAKDPKGNPIQIPVVVSRGVMAEQPKGTIPSVERDRITKYKFTRIVKQIDDTFGKLTVISSFKMSDAFTAGLTDKDVWVKYAPRMLDARAFSIGSKEIAADVLLGVYTISELADEFNVKYTVSASLEESIVH